MKSFLLFITTLLFLHVPAQTPPTEIMNFKNLSDMKTARAGIATSSDSNYIYVTGGFPKSAVGSDIIEKYDVKNDTWSLLTDSLVSKAYASSLIVGNNLYVLNGTVKGKLNKKVEVVNLVTGKISHTTDNPLPRRIGGTAVWENCIYVFGGATGVDTMSNAILYTDRLLKFDIITKKWTELARMPEAKETRGEIIDGKLYVLGGYNGRKATNGVDVYDITSNTWTSLDNLPSRLAGHATVSKGNKIYIAGDYKEMGTVACYDVSTNVYTPFRNNLIRRRHAGAAIVNGRLYIMGGNQSSDSNTVLNSMQSASLPRE